MKKLDVMKFLGFVLLFLLFVMLEGCKGFTESMGVRPTGYESENGKVSYSCGEPNDQCWMKCTKVVDGHKFFSERKSMFCTPKEQDNEPTASVPVS